MIKKIAYVFPGQGSQHVGMGKTLSDSFDVARRTFEEADDALRFGISKLSFFGPQGELDLTENTQPALLAASIAALRVLNEKGGPDPSLLAGHSLGEYTALVAAGAITFPDALRLVRLRGKFMQEAVKEGEGKMCAILGLGLDEVKRVCTEASTGNSVAVPANINSPEQVVISGEASAIERAARLASEAGAKRVVPLSVSAPSHSPLMARAAERLSEELKRIEFRRPGVPVVTNVEAEPVGDPARLPGLLTRQLVSPVRWVDVVRRMKAEGVATIVEVGPGKVLTNLIKRIDKEINTANLGEAKDVEGVLAAVTVAV